MKYILIFILFLSLSNNSYCQKTANKPTRQQTEAWVIEKIKKYHVRETYFSFDILNKKVTGHNNNFNFVFENDNLIITYNVVEFTSNRFLIDGPEIEEKKSSESITIPLNTLTNKEFIKEGYLVFQSNYNSFIRRSNNMPQAPNNWYGTQIHENEEENFMERFNKAMIHLISFTKKTKSTEIF